MSKATTSPADKRSDAVVVLTCFYSASDETYPAGAKIRVTEEEAQRLVALGSAVLAQD